MELPNPVEPGRGEILGAVLLGLVRSFKSIEAISGNTASVLVDGLTPTGWFPIDHFFEVLDALTGRDVDYDPILFAAGCSFIQDWYDRGPGRNVIHRVDDFLTIQGTKSGYAAAHRGDPAVIGSQTLVAHEPDTGHAIIEGVNPYPAAFEHGIFATGIHLAGDVALSEITWTETPVDARLSRKVYSLRYRRKDPSAEAGADALLRHVHLDDVTPIAEPAVDALAMRCRTLEMRLARERAFYEQSNLLLSRATDEIFALSNRLEVLAHHDELTGLFNRRAMIDRAHGLLSLAMRQESPLAVAVLDIDNFKAINDTYGHGAGDRALCTVAETLRSRIRSSDLVGRIGGEEFLILLPDTGLAGAIQLVEGLREAIESATAVCPYHLTVSAGVAVAEDDDFETLFQRADNALYVAKDNGRNQVRVAAPS